MFDFYDYFEESYQYALESIVYNKIPKSDSKQFSLVFNDMYEVVRKDDKGLNITLSRHVSFNPPNYFTMDIKYDILFTAKKGKDAAVLTDAQIIESLEKNDLMSAVFSRISVLISQITMLGTMNPLVLPPNYIPSDATEQKPEAKS